MSLLITERVTQLQLALDNIFLLYSLAANFNVCSTVLDRPEALHIDQSLRVAAPGFARAKL